MNPGMADTARKAFISAVVVVAVVAGALALWKLKLVISILFLALIIAAAMRPGVEKLRELRIPRGFGILVHYIVLFGIVALFFYLVVPRASHQVQAALHNLPQKAAHSHGIRKEILTALNKRLQHLPSGSKLVHPALSIGKRAFEIVIGIFFTFAIAAYWIFERARFQRVVTSLVPIKNRRVVRDTWELIDLRLGAFVRGQLLLVALVGIVLSVAFELIGLHYWILVGAFAGVVEIVPVIGPLLAGVLAIGVGLTSSVGTAVAAGLCVLGVRLLEDYVIVPKVLGEAVGLSPIIIIVSVTSVGILFGGFDVLLAVPFAAVLATLVDVIVLNKDPAKEEVPSVIFPAQDLEE